MTATILQFKPRAKMPDPRNGEVYACAAWCWEKDVLGNDTETSAGFIVVHMSESGGSAGIEGGYDTFEEADRAARAQAQRRGAVYVGGAA